MSRINNLFRAWQAERRRTRELHENLEGLTDPTFIERATADKQRSVYLKLHDRVYSKLGPIGKWLHRLTCQEVHA